MDGIVSAHGWSAFGGTHRHHNVVTGKVSVLIPVRWKRRGFSVIAETALLHKPTGKVHFIECTTFGMPTCGLNTRSRPVELFRVKRTAITCLRCLTIVLLKLNRLRPLCGGEI